LNSLLRPHHRLYLAAAFLDCAMMVGVTALPFLIMHRLGGEALMTGVIMALHSVAYAAVSLASSRFVERARNGLVWAVVGVVDIGVLFSLACLTDNPYLFSLVSTIGFAGLALAWPALWSWLGAEPDVAIRARRISHYNLAWSAGLALGPLFAGRLYVIDYRLPFLFVFLLAMLALVLVLSLPHEKKHYQAADAEQHEANTANVRLSEVHLHCGWLACFLGIALLGASRSVFPVRVDDLVDAGRLLSYPGHSAVVAFSLLSFSLNVARVLVFILMGMTRRWQHRFVYLLVCQAAAAAAFWLLGSTESFVLMLLCFALVGVNAGVAFFASVFYSLADPALKHRRAAINEGMIGAGNFAGMMGFGLIAHSYGIALPFRWMPLVILAGVAAQFVVLQRGIRRLGAAGLTDSPKCGNF